MQDAGPPLSESSHWGRALETPLATFLRTETGSAAVLLGATVAALVWANADLSSYEKVWHTTLTVRIGSGEVSQPLVDWVNRGLMTLFFFVVGLEARREFDMGELRERRRVALPLAAGLSGVAVPIAIFLVFNAGRASAHGWGAAMSTDTAFALGVLALAGPRSLGRLRAYLLTVAVVDDLTSLVVIVTVYDKHLDPVPLLVAVGIFCAVLATRAAGIRSGLAYGGLGIAAWVALTKSGVDPIILGLAMGLIVYAHPASRSDLERASQLFRRFREQPTADLARLARTGVAAALSPNDRLQQIYHPWTAYVVVPLFALTNAGIALSGSFLGRSFTSPVTLGILVGYVAGKPIGIIGSSWAVARASRGRLRPPVGWAAVTGAGTVAGIGFTVSLLIATRAFSGTQLAEAKVGVLAAGLASAGLTWSVFAVTARLAQPARARALLGTADLVVDLAAPVDPHRDHVRGPKRAPVTLVEYGDFECPYCGRAEPVVRELLADQGDVSYVWRHLPLTDVHPHAQMAAEASEAAARQGAFWEMHDLLMRHQGELRPPDLARYAAQIGIDVTRFERDLRERAGASHVAEDVDSADLSGVSGTPTFFVNGRRHHGAYDIDTLTAAVKAARARSVLVGR
ncbi:MAG: Na+/H+ antiporter NhaA [Acidimicrobiales bacterium]